MWVRIRGNVRYMGTRKGGEDRHKESQTGRNEGKKDTKGTFVEFFFRGVDSRNINTFRQTVILSLIGFHLKISCSFADDIILSRFRRGHPSLSPFVRKTPRCKTP